MERSTAPRLARLPVALAVALCIAAGAIATSARAVGTGARGPRAIHTPAHPVAAAPAGAASLAATVEQQTGEKPSQLSTRSVCGKPSAGRVGCLAEVLVSARTQDPVTPRVARASSGTHLQAARGVAPSVSAGATPAAESAATAPPPGTPAFLQQAYDLGFLSSTDGVGDTIAIVDSFDDPTSASDMQTFRTRFGLPGCGVSNDCFTRVNQSGQTSEYPPADPTGGWEVEESLDLDAASALCPLCHIVLVEANSISVSDVQAAAQTAAMMGANQISMSLGSAGASEPPGPWAFPGISSLAATGDSGYDGPGKIDFPAGDPGVTAVGGTDLTAAGNARGFAESAWEKAGSGCNPAIAIPSYQAGTGACMGRSAADVSAVAGGADLDVYDSTPFRGSSGWIVVGGTSLATPLTAAFEALTGIDSANSPSWTYLHADLLNDITSGNNDTASGDLGGACAGGIVYICAARPGYDGPTGNGSINGDVVTGAPGIGGTYTSSVAATTAVVAGGVYPNSEDTVYRFEYGSTTSLRSADDRVRTSARAPRSSRSRQPYRADSWDHVPLPAGRDQSQGDRIRIRRDLHDGQNPGDHRPAHDQHHRASGRRPDPGPARSLEPDRRGLLPMAGLHHERRQLLHQHHRCDVELLRADLSRRRAVAACRRHRIELVRLRHCVFGDDRPGRRAAGPGPGPAPEPHDQHDQHVASTESAEQ